MPGVVATGGQVGHVKVGHVMGGGEIGHVRGGGQVGISIEAAFRKCIHYVLLIQSTIM